MIFAKPPVVEVVAELRWAGLGVALPISAPGVMTPGLAPIQASSQAEEFFMRFGAKVAENGFSQSQQLVPPGFPWLPHQPIWRYMRSSPKEGLSLYQLGPGLFTANIPPPYQAWEHFRSVIRAGVESLLNCRDDSEKNIVFAPLLLRYINAFGPEFTQEMPLIDFLIKKLGFCVSPPNIISELADSSQSIRPSLQFGVQLKDDLFMNIIVGDGSTNGNPALIMDTTISSVKAIKPNLEDVMQTFDKTHNILNTAFIDITKPIHDLMQPKGEKS